MTANGHVSDSRPALPLRHDGRNSTWATRSATLTDVTALAGPPFQQLHVGRGLAIGDLDNDGRLDAVMVAQNEPLVYSPQRTEAGRRPESLPRHSASRGRNRTGMGSAPW